MLWCATSGLWQAHFDFHSAQRHNSCSKSLQHYWCIRATPIAHNATINCWSVPMSPDVFVIIFVMRLFWHYLPYHDSMISIIKIFIINIIIKSWNLSSLAHTWKTGCSFTDELVQLEHQRLFSNWSQQIRGNYHANFPLHGKFGR